MLPLGKSAKQQIGDPKEVNRDRALLRVAWLTISKFKLVASTGHAISQGLLPSDHQFA